MKKVLIAILIICLSFSFFVQIKLNGKIAALQVEINTIQDDYKHLSTYVHEELALSEPMTQDEIETIQHNMNMLKEFYAVQSDRPAAIAQQCYTLEKIGKMESSWIISIEKHVIPENSYYCIETVTNDGEHYWFEFDYNTSFIHTIYKGINKDTVLFAVVYD